MRSATSYFNSTLYHKTMSRFWPLWTAYGVIWLFLIPLNMLNTYFRQYSYDSPVNRLLREALDLNQTGFMGGGLFLAVFCAILCAMAVFGYLYNSRSACWTHALPMRREALFTTQYLAGLSFLLLPQAAVAVLAAMVEMALLPMGNWGEALGALLIWLAIQSGLCLFFFSFAAFCAMFTGHILALPAFYGILNILATVIYSLLEALMVQFFFGYNAYLRAQRIVDYFSPCYAFMDALYRSASDDLRPFYLTTAAYAAVGVVLAIVSLYVYRRRHVETAGDVVAIPLVRPLFKYGVSFCTGLCFGMFTSVFFGWGWGGSIAALIPCVLVWSVIGYFAAEMLLCKSFRVFRHWKGAMIMPAVLLALCLACAFDLFGVESRVPGADQVEVLTVSFGNGYPDDSGRRYSADFTDPDSIRKFLELHQVLVNERDRLDPDSSRYEPGNDYTDLQLWYDLKGGGTLNRQYYSLPLYREDLDREGSFTNLFQRLCEDRDITAKAYDFEGFLKEGSLTGAYLDFVNDASGKRYDGYVYLNEYVQLWDAVQADFAEGTIGVRYLFDLDEERYANTYYTDLCFSASVYQDPEWPSYETGPGGYSYSSTLRITLTPNARHTLAALEKTGVFEEGWSLVPREAYDTSGGYPTLAY